MLIFLMHVANCCQKLISGVADTMFVNSKKPSHDDISTTLLRSHPEKFNLTNVAKLNIAVQQVRILVFACVYVYLYQKLRFMPRSHYLHNFGVFRGSCINVGASLREFFFLYVKTLKL